MSFSDTGHSFADRDSFQRHVADRGLFPGCVGVTLHHTASPSLAMRPDGLTYQHMQNIRDYYSNSLGWSAGPHLFCDDRRIMCMTPLNERGVHAVSFNSSRIGIEVLGDYDSEDPRTGRGLAAWTRAAQCVVDLGFADSFNFHRDDPRTSKTCPGRNVERPWVERMIDAASGQQQQEPAIQFGSIPVRIQNNQVISPIVDTLVLLGVPFAYDTHSWQGISVVYYDTETETSWANLSQLLSIHNNS